MDTTQDAIKINLIRDREEPGNISVICLGAAMSLILFLAVECLAFQVFNMDTNGVNKYVYAIVGALTIVVLSASNNILAKRYRYGRVYVAVGYVILFIMAAVIFRVRFKYGLNSFADELALLRTDATGLIQRRFDTGPDPSWAMRRASPFAASLTAAMSYVVAFEGKKTAAVLVAALLIAGLSMSLVEPNIYFAGVMGTLLFTVGVRFLMDNCGQIKDKGVAVNAISAAALFAAAVVAISLIAWQTESSHQGLKEKSETWIHKHRYEKKENPLPEGDLRNLDSFKPTGRVSLTVEMSSPETLYLKGFVGEKFDDGRWERIGGDFYRKNSNMFYWLHKEGFYGQSQRAMLNKLINDGKVETLKVKNVNACRRYVYAPYSLYQEKNRITDERNIGDATIIRRGDKDTVAMSYIPGTVYQSYKLQSEYASGVDETKEISAYRDEESSYRDIVYEYYTNIPDDVEKTLGDVLGEKEKLSTTEAKARILEYLDKNTTYRVDVGSSGRGDIINWFLTERKAGYSVHYATATTMMLRYYGVPSRYVEGFMVNKEEAKNISKNVPYPITEKNAHAWAEYYLDGVGWIPFESVPGKRDSNMYAAAGMTQTKEGSEGLGGGPGNAEKQNNETDKTEKISDKNDFNNPINNWRNVFVFKRAILFVLITVMLLAVLTVVFLRRLRLKRFIKTFEGEDIRRGVINAFAYGSFLKRRGNKNDLYEDEKAKDSLYASASSINDMALYSTMEIEAAQRNTVLEMKEKALSEFRSGRNVVQKIYDRLIICIY